MNQKDLAGKIAAKVGTKKNLVGKIIDAQLEIITEALKKGEKVRLVGFGNFILRKRIARAGRNPQTGDKISIPETKSPGFVPGINLKKAIKG